jgi:hypothetical protein
MAEAELVEAVALSRPAQDPFHQPPSKSAFKDILYGSVSLLFSPRLAPADNTSGKIAGIVSKTFEHPFDLVKVSALLAASCACCAEPPASFFDSNRSDFKVSL